MDPRILKTSIKAGISRAAITYEDIHGAIAILRDNCLQLHVYSNQDKFALVVSHTPSNFTSFSIDQQDHEVPPFYHSYHGTVMEHIPVSLISSFPLPEELRDFLVWASLTTTSQDRPCRAVGCKMRPMLTATDEFTCHTTSRVFKMKLIAPSKSSNIVYLIICRRCGQQYVGKAGQPLHRRFNNHCFKNAHRRTEEFSVAELFNGNGHTCRHDRCSGRPTTL